MAEKTIKLKVPAEPKAEYVSVGNYGTELVPNATVEVTHRPFADWLVREHGLEIVSGEEPAGGQQQPEKTEEQIFAEKLEAEYPADFPDRKILIGQKIPIETARGLDRDQLIALKNVGEAKADAILSYFASETAATGTDNPNGTSEGGNE